MNTTPRRRGVANKCAPHTIRSDTLMSVVREGALAPQLDTTLSTVSNGNGGRLRIAKHHNLAFYRTLRNNPGPDRRRLLNEQFPSRIAWTDGRWKAIMTAWHYTMQKSKTLRWLRSMQARHSPTTHILSPVKDTQVIYALYHIDLPRRIYVGQTITTAFERFQRHVGNARRIFKTGDNGWTEPLHRHNVWLLPHSTASTFKSSNQASLIFTKTRLSAPSKLLAILPKLPFPAEYTQPESVRRML